jgi:Holliday junction resolvasome RuvABC endonuclease subunit
MVSVLLGVAIEGRLDASDALAIAICCVLRRNGEATSAPATRGDWRSALARKVGR